MGHVRRPPIGRGEQHVHAWKVAQQHMMESLRKALRVGEGRRVLGDILTLGHFGETLNPKDEVQVAEYNFALTIARMAGALDMVYSQLGIPVREEK